MNTLTKAQEEKLKCEVAATVKAHNFTIGIDDRAYRDLGNGFTAHVYRSGFTRGNAYIFGLSNDEDEIVLKRTVRDEPGNMVREIAKFCDDPMKYFHTLTSPKNEVD